MSETENEVRRSSSSLGKIGNRDYTHPVQLAQGQEVGNFSFGSSIVLLFEAPLGLEFTMKPFEKVKLGNHVL